MQPKCRCYTMSTSLVAAYNITRNHTNYVPPIDIDLDDCCLEEQKILKVSKMDPIRIDDANLDELRHAKHRLEQFGEALDLEMNDSFVRRHSGFLGSFIAIIFVFTVIVLICCCLSKYC